jgi:hypothetical protein
MFADQVYYHSQRQIRFITILSSQIPEVSAGLDPVYYHFPAVLEGC